MSNQQFYFCKSELPPEAAQHGAKIMWRPSLVFFQADLSTKGLALFTTHENADGYRLLLEREQSYPITVELFEDIPAYASCVVEHRRSANKAYRGTPVYIDPPNLFCKNIKVSFDSLEKFLFKHFQSRMPWAHDLVGFSHHRGFTVELLKDRVTHKFVAVGMKGIFNDRESISTAIEDALDTTDEVYVKRTEPNVDAEAVLNEVLEHVARVAPSASAT